MNSSMHSTSPLEKLPQQQNKELAHPPVQHERGDFYCRNLLSRKNPTASQSENKSYGADEGGRTHTPYGTGS